MDFSKFDIESLMTAAEYKIEHAADGTIVSYKGQVLKDARGVPLTPYKAISSWMKDQEKPPREIFPGRGKLDELGISGPFITTAKQFYEYCEHNGLTSQDQMTALLLTIQESNPKFQL